MHNSPAFSCPPSFIAHSLRLAENAVQSLRRDRQELLSAGSNRLAQFGGTDMVNLCAAVEREKRRFSRVRCARGPAPYR